MMFLGFVHVGAGISGSSLFMAEYYSLWMYQNVFMLSCSVNKDILNTGPPVSVWKYFILIGEDLRIELCNNIMYACLKHCGRVLQSCAPFCSTISNGWVPAASPLHRCLLGQALGYSRASGRVVVFLPGTDMSFSGYK